MSQVIKGEQLLAEADKHPTILPYTENVQEYTITKRFLFIFKRKIKKTYVAHWGVKVKADHVYYLGNGDRTVLDLTELGVHPNGEKWENIAAEAIQQYLQDYNVTAYGLTNTKPMESNLTRECAEKLGVK